MNKKRLGAIILLFACLIIYLVCTSSGNKEYSLHIDAVMDTYADITLITDKNGDKLADNAAQILYDLENKFSHTKKESEISRLNNSHSEEVSEDTYEIIKKSGEITDASKGHFDITVGAVSEEWSKTFENGILPDDNKLSTELESVGYGTIKLENGRVNITKDGQKINLGAIAKGYAADKIKAYLDENDVENALVNFGGNIWVKGRNKKGELWNVGVRNPKSETDILLSLRVSDKFVITSGNYIRFRDIDSVRYHHIIDAKTGYPTQNNLTGVTVVSDSGFFGDALSTSCFLLGFEEGRKLAESYNVQIIFVTEDNKVYYSSSLEESVKKLSDEYEYIPF